MAATAPVNMGHMGGGGAGVLRVRFPTKVGYCVRVMRSFGEHIRDPNEEATLNQNEAKPAETTAVHSSNSTVTVIVIVMLVVIVKSTGNTAEIVFKLYHQ